MGNFIVTITLNKHKMKIAVVSFFAFIVLANATSLDSILESKEKAASRLRARRSLDPDEWCLGTLKNPRCWKNFAKAVWKPARIIGQNLVTRAEGRDLYWCTVGCKVGDGFKDLVGTAHEEKREKKEEYCEAMQNDACVLPEVGCAQCCDKIPKSLACLDKVKNACPAFYRANCNANAQSGAARLEQTVNQAMKDNSNEE